MIYIYFHPQTRDLYVSLGLANWFLTCLGLVLEACAANNSHVCIITDDVIEGEEMDPTVEVLSVLTNHGVMLEAVTWERVQ